MPTRRLLRLHPPDPSGHHLELAIIDQPAPDPVVPPTAPGFGAPQWRAVLEAVAELTRDLVVVSAIDHADHVTRIKYVNEAFLRITGYERDAVVDRPADLLVGPATDADAIQRIENAMQAGESITEELVLHDRHGRPFPVEGTFSRVEGPDETMTWLVATYHHLANRVAAQAALSRSEGWAEAIVRGITDLVLTTDRTGVITYASPASEEMLGVRPDELIGRMHRDLFDPEDRDETEKVFDPTHRDQAGSARYEAGIRHRDGSRRILNVVVTDMLDDPSVGGLVINVRDVTGRRVVEDLLAEQAELLEAIARGAPLEITLQKITQMIEHVLDGANCAIGIFDPDGAIRVRAAPSLPRQIVSMLDALAPDSAAGIDVRRSRGETFSYDLTAPNPIGPPEIFANHGFALCREAPVLAPGSGELLGALSVFHPEAGRPSSLEVDLIDRALNLAAIAIERRRFESTLEYQALYDPLTGLPNRTLLQSRIQDALVRAGRLDTGVAVLFVDLDRFKVINDSVGHAVGDKMLIEVTERFKEPLRPGDTMGRFGGDEFMIVCSRIPDEDAAADAAAQFLRQLEAPIKLDDGEIFLTASVGIAFDIDGVATAESLIRNADVAMYRAKHQGRNQSVVFQEHVDQQKVDQLALEQALRHALDAEEFELYFQPAVRLSDGAMTHVEALVRWHRPGHGLVFPDNFIPLAEETGLIVPMGWWILEEACQQAAAWPDLPGGNKVEVAVNLAAKQLASPELLTVVSRVLERTGLDPARLCLEVTESALVQDVEQAKAALLDIKALGVHLAIDDFGTGYASLDYVRQFSMADYLKIDRSFVEGVEKEGSQEEAIVTAAIALARSLGLTVIAEGVETLFQMEALRGLSCELAQGYLFSRPIPIGPAIELLCNHA